jgi:CheY-like chemotaxis protein
MSNEGDSTVFDVLVVDDNPADAEVIKYAFGECRDVRTRIEVLADPRDAVPYLYGAGKFANVVVPDLILLDYHMPTDGGRALAEIKGNPDLLTPVIVFTGSGNPKQVEEIYRRHANCCFFKPSNLPDMLAVACEIATHWLKRSMLPSKKRPNNNGPRDAHA